MQKRHILAAASMMLVAAPVAAQPSAKPAATPTPAPSRPITQREPNAVDVVTTPMSDLNLRKGEIPPILLAAQAEPYALRGLARCPQISAEVARLDAVLGDDFDVAQNSGQKISAGKVAQSVVGSFIPFRGLIREISGANAEERRLQYAIYAGSARRAFLKGVGQQRGCAWPARSATPEMLARVARANEEKAAAKAPEERPAR